MQGKSLRPLLNEQLPENTEFRNAVYYHYYDFPAFHMVKRHYGIRTDRYKLIHFYDDIDQWELYDLEKDPLEEDNLYGNAEYADIQKKLHAELKDLQQKYEVTEEEFKTTPEAQVKQAYRNFAKLAGENPETYPDAKSIEVD